MVEQAPVREAERVIDAEFTEKTEAKEELPVKTEKVVLPEGTIEFELDEEEHLFDVGEVSPSEGNFTQAEKAGNLSGPSSHNSASFSGQETSRKWEKPSVRQELKKMKPSRDSAGRHRRAGETEKPAAKKEKSERQVRRYGFNEYDPRWSRGRTGSRTAAVKRRVCSYEKTAEGRSVGRG